MKKGDTGPFHLSPEQRVDVRLYAKVGYIEGKVDGIADQLSTALPRIEQHILASERPSKISLAPATAADKKLIAGLITAITILVTALSALIGKVLEAF